MKKRALGSITVTNLLTSMISPKASAIESNTYTPVLITVENAQQFGIDYDSLRNLFENFRPTQPNEIFKMVPHEEKGFINFSSFDGYSINTIFKYTPVEPNALGGGNK